ncbi:hypothetical protein [Desulfospira joergensenii]|uniref:hypothetical protein n=1 Tax=Desulfospira joergensenii TaxID=53329 RepID=UPI0003B702B0
MDVLGLFNDIIDADEFANLTEPWKGTGADPSTYLFRDNVHPTTRGHWFLADYAIKVLSTPLRSGFLMMGAGIVCLVGFRRKTAWPSLILLFY